MNFKDPKRHKSLQPERKDVTDPLMSLLRAKGWWVKKIHGNEFQSGLPDLYAFHPGYGQRWIECKHPSRIRLEYGGLDESQIKQFHEMTTFGIGIWIITSPAQYNLLLGKANWHSYCYYKGTR